MEIKIFVPSNRYNVVTRYINNYNLFKIDTELNFDLENIQITVHINQYTPQEKVDRLMKFIKYKIQTTTAHKRTTRTKSWFIFNLPIFFNLKQKRL